MWVEMLFSVEAAGNVYTRMQRHKRPSNFKYYLSMRRCLGTARPVDGRLVKEVMIGDKKLEIVPEFCYLGDMLSAGGGCELASIARCKC